MSEVFSGSTLVRTADSHDKTSGWIKQTGLSLLLLNKCLNYFPALPFD